MDQDINRDLRDLEAEFKMLCQRLDDRITRVGKMPPERGLALARSVKRISKAAKKLGITVHKRIGFKFEHVPATGRIQTHRNGVKPNYDSVHDGVDLKFEGIPILFYRMEKRTHSWRTAARYWWAQTFSYWEVDDPLYREGGMVRHPLAIKAMNSKANMKDEKEVIRFVENAARSKLVKLAMEGDNWKEALWLKSQTVIDAMSRCESGST